MKKHIINTYSNEVILFPDNYNVEFKKDISKETTILVNTIILNIQKIERVEFYMLKAFIYNDKIEINLIRNINGSKYIHGRFFVYDLFYLEENSLYEFYDQKEKENFIRKRKIESIL